MKIIFILSAAHSGSTLLELILDSHSKIIGVGEINHLKKDNICSCGKKINECSLWGEIINQKQFGSLIIQRSLINFILGRKKFHLIQGNKLKLLLNSKKMIDFNFYIYNKVLEKSKATYLIDSSKSIDRLTFLTQCKKIEPIIIHLVRDRRGVAWSFIQKYKKSPLKTMRNWFLFNLMVEYLKKKYIYLYVNYENFTDNPEVTIRKILKLINLRYETGMLMFNDFVHHQVEGNRMRFLNDNRIRKSEAWKIKLPLKYKRLFNILFGCMNYYYLKLKQ